jgi:hypothetical protein
MPKGALLSCRLDASHDRAFFLKHVLPAKHIYFSEYEKLLRYGTEAEAEQHAWTSMEKLRLNFEDEETLAANLYGLCAMGRVDLEAVSGKTAEFWKLYGKKKAAFTQLLRNRALFEAYVGHVFAKLANFGY